MDLQDLVVMTAERMRSTTDGTPRYEVIAAALADAIASGALAEGERLPTVRKLTQALGVSGTTIVAAYTQLADRGLVRGEVGRGTFVGAREPAHEPAPTAPWPTAARPRSVGGQLAWRKRTLVNTEQRLRAAHPAARDLTRGGPDVALFPVKAIQRAWGKAARGIKAEDLQYPLSASVVPELAEALLPHLAADDVPAGPQDLIAASSAQQLLSLALAVLTSRNGGEQLVVAVEEPGYQTAMDTFERAGCALTPVRIDELGATPNALDAALAGGASLALLTPRALSPTGASWTVERREQLADVLARHPHVTIIEDDPFGGVAEARPGSLLGDQRLADRVLYIRSLSKTIAPDLRLAVGVARQPLVSLVAEEKSFADGWTSRFTQRVAGLLLADPEVPRGLAAAGTVYAERRRAAAAAIDELLAPAGGGATPGRDGLHVWLRLPAGLDAADVLERAAGSGILAAPGEPFYVRPGHSGTVRLNAGGAGSTDDARRAGEIVATAAVDVGARIATAITV